MIAYIHFLNKKADQIYSILDPTRVETKIEVIESK